MTPASSVPLSFSEQITLRRVAHGQSDGTRLPAPDLARLRQLALIDGDVRTLQLTMAGRRRFDALPRPTASKSIDVEGTMTNIIERLRASNDDNPAAAGKRRRRP
jgi:hypothetical protein